MRLPTCHVSGITHQASRSPRRRAGSAVVVLIAILAILLIYVAANLRTLANLGRELRLLERQQTHRLRVAASKTNSPPASVVNTNAMPSPRKD